MGLLFMNWWTFFFKINYIDYWLGLTAGRHVLKPRVRVEIEKIINSSSFRCLPSDAVERPMNSCVR